MAKQGKYTNKKKGKSSNTKKTMQNRITTDKPKLPKNPTRPDDVKHNAAVKENIPTLEKEAVIQEQSVQESPNVVYSEDNPSIKTTMDTVGLTVEEIIREINIERPDPQAYVHQTDGSATANAVEYKNPIRQRQKEEAARAVMATIEDVADNMPELTKPTIPTKESIQKKRKTSQSSTRRPDAHKKRPGAKNGTNNKPKKRKESTILFEAYDYEYSIKQAERDGTIAGFYCLGFMAVIVGFYALMSWIFPVISVDAMANTLIEWVMLAAIGEGPIVAFMDVFISIIGTIAEWIIGWPIW